MEVLEAIDVLVECGPGIERGWEAGILYACFKKPQQRRDFFAEVLRRHRFGALEFLRRLSLIRIGFRVLPVK